MQHKFVLLLLVLAKRRVAISWMAREGPQIGRWEADVREWAVAKEVCLKKCRHDDKLREDLEI